MSNSVHGHEVIALMVAQGSPILQQELIALMANKFGECAHYHTCSAEGLSAVALIELLLNKGKFQVTPQGITVVAGRKCQH
ncbi:YecH family metal-binding protein [Shewanella sp.]|uniref:YecH family metal-binding protein n=1 Tax=Shewanella sp. TaxID=50422 RepID=UPI003F3A5E36